MANGFDKNNSHEENVKRSIDIILGTDTELKFRKKSIEDHKRALFNDVINTLIMVDQRSSILDEVHYLDMDRYDKPFYEIINSLLGLYFTRDQCRIIYFYVYDRYQSDGSIIDLTDNSGKNIALNTPDQLWFLLKTMENAKR
jgi:hypothetical protein